MNTCPCCSNRMLRHARHREVYWFCRSCWQEMPFIAASPKLGLLSPSLEHQFWSAAGTRSPITV